MKRAGCKYRGKTAIEHMCPFEGHVEAEWGDGAIPETYYPPTYKKGASGRCDLFNQKYQCPHYPRLTNRPGRSLLDKLLGR
jgi:hypothetical protein